MHVEADNLDVDVDLRSLYKCVIKNVIYTVYNKVVYMLYCMHCMLYNLTVFVH